LQVPRQHLARGTQWPHQRQLLVRDRLRLCRLLLTQPGPTTLLRRPPPWPSRAASSSSRSGAAGSPSTPSSTCTIVLTTSEHCLGSCTMQALPTSTQKTRETTAAERTSGTRWLWNGSRTFWTRTEVAPCPTRPSTG